MEGNVERSTEKQNLKGKIAKIPLVDETLTRKGEAADAQVTGQEIARLDKRLDDLIKELIDGGQEGEDEII